jgi:DeoR/GlpR family transcriptional regulator of sugar metabolism
LGEEIQRVKNESGGEQMVPEARRAEIMEMLREHGSVSVNDVQARLGISPMTARRDLAELARRGFALRTHGGAVLPSLSAHEDSFATRLAVEADAKVALANAAVAMLKPRDAVFLDSSTTTYYVARRILDLALEVTVVTNSLSIMQLLAKQSNPSAELVAVGGMLRSLTQSFVGPDAVRSIGNHFTDYAFFSVKALAENGIIADADPLEAEVKRVMIDQARKPVLLIDRTKLAARGLHSIAPVSLVSEILAHGTGESDLRPLKRFGVQIRTVSDERDRSLPD